MLYVIASLLSSASLASAGVPFDLADCPAPRAPKWQFDGPLACPEPEQYSASTGFDDVIELTPGCPVDVELGLHGQRFFKVNRSSLYSQFQFRWGMHDKSFLTLFAWHGVPSLQGRNHEDYHLPFDQVGAKSYSPAVDGKDFYHVGEFAAGHCGDGDTVEAGDTPTPCVGPHASEHSGYLYVTVVGFGFPGGETHRGRVSFDFLSAPDTIKPSHLSALHELYTSTCAPSAAELPVFDAATGAHWQRNEHVEGLYSSVKPSPDFAYLANFSTSGSERDSDRIAYCDWAYKVDFAGATCKTLGDHGVTCDAEGNVIGLSLSRKGLRGKLPASFASLDALTTVDLSYNQLSGELPASLLSLGRLLTLDVRQNAFGGAIPCPGADVPTLALTRLFLSDNRFTGAMPSCLFERLPLLERARFDDLAELAPGPLPASVKLATRLVVLSANNARRTGALPRELGCLPQLSSLDLGSNEIDGPLEQDVIDALPRLYELDVSFNQLSGRVPVFGEGHDSIRLLRLNNNRFSGRLTEQLLAFGRHQSKRATSILNIENNRFTGPLPETFREVLTDANPVNELYAGGNHFRCEGQTDAFPLWARRMHRLVSPSLLQEFADPRFGKCARLPAVHAAHNPKIGQQMAVYGEHFEPSDELACKLGERRFPAVWVSATEILCTIPDDLAHAPGDAVALAVANYGDDFTDAPLEIMLHLSPPPPSPFAPPPAPSAPLPQSDGVSRRVAALASGIVSGVVLLVLVCFAYVIARERQGKPVFAPVLKELGVIDVQAKIAPATTSAKVSDDEGTATSTRTSPANSQESGESV